MRAAILALEKARDNAIRSLDRAREAGKHESYMSAIRVSIVEYEKALRILTWADEHSRVLNQAQALIDYGKDN